MDIIEMPIAEIIPYENNPRKNDGAIEAVANSIKEFGFKVPIIIDKDNVIVAGHTRLKAAEKLGLESVPVIKADDLTDEQIKAFRLADNKTAELAEWDFSALEEELERLKNIDMSQFGFDIDNEAELLLNNEELDNVPDVPKEAKTKLGDIYRLGNHRLICGDSTDVAVIDRLMDGVKADGIKRTD